MQWQQGDQVGEAAAEGEVDNTEAGGFFGLFGREREGPRPTVIPAAARGETWAPWAWLHLRTRRDPGRGLRR